MGSMHDKQSDGGGGIGFNFTFGGGGKGKAKGGAGSGEGVEGLLGNLTSFLEKIEQLAEKGQELRESGVLDGVEGSDKKIQYGFSISTAKGEGGSNRVKVEPFGNVKRDKETGAARVDEVREPMTDVFEEADGVLVIAEMPGVDAEHVKVSVAGDILTIEAEQGAKRYAKEVLLPAPAAGEPRVACNNGVVEIRVDRVASEGAGDRDDAAA
jgi:HSP20 family protein